MNRTCLARQQQRERDKHEERLRTRRHQARTSAHQVQEDFAPNHSSPATNFDGGDDDALFDVESSCIDHNAGMQNPGPMNNNIELGEEDIHDEPFLDDEIRTHFLETLGVTLNTANGETLLNNIIHNHLDEADDNDPIVPPPIGTVSPMDHLEPHERVGLPYRYSDAKFGSYMSKSLSPKLLELLKE
jgi:hypothetical protein